VKAWLYAPILSIWHPSAYSVRVPVLLVGSLTVWLFFLIMCRTVGHAAALVGAALLATDPIFLLTTCFDWGPVALHHFFLVAGLLLLVTGSHMQSTTRLACGFFLFGLGLWDKVTFAWALVALASAFAIVYPRPLLASLRNRKRALRFAAWFGLGCLPLICYNVIHPLTTLRTNVWLPTSVSSQFYMLRMTLNGSGLFEWLNSKDLELPAISGGVVPGWSSWLSRAFGHPKHTLLGVVLAAVLCLAPLLWLRRRQMPLARGGPDKILWMAIIAMVLFWGAMVFPYNGGGSIHHTILLWPLPQFIVAAAFAGISCRFRRLAIIAVTAVVAVLLAVNALVINKYYVELATKGPAVQWSDASYSLSDTLRRLAPRYVVLTDWGLRGSLLLLNQGNLPMTDLSFILAKRQLPGEDQSTLRLWLSQPGTIFAGHTPGDEVFSGVNANLEAFARDNRYQKEVLERVRDRHGRAIFEIFRLHRM
jgi:hypothetical protein